LIAVNAPCRTTRLGSRWAKPTAIQSSDETRYSAKPVADHAEIERDQHRPGNSGDGPDPFRGAERQLRGAGHRRLEVRTTRPTMRTSSALRS
jgi:hypothetical protein